MASLRKRGRNWYVRYRDAHGKQNEVKAGPDKSMTQRIANGLESQVAAVRSGVADPREAGWAEAERRPLTDHVHDWHADLLARGRKGYYADLARDRVLRLIESTRAQRISQLTLSAVQSAVAELRSIPRRSGNKGLSDRTVFHHVRNIKGFAKWLWKDGRVREDPMAHLSPPAVVSKRTRKALDPEDGARLIAATRSEPCRWGMMGEDRSILYAVALGTGFRAGELLSLTPEDFDLAATPPTIRCRAAYAKNKQEAVQPIRPELADLVRGWVVGKAPGTPLFDFRVDNAARMVREDLQAAGIASPGDYDFHCLRHTYVSMLVRSGVSIKTVQALARHADPAMTLGVYTHVGVHDLARGLDGLAHILPAPCVSAGLTGTDPTPVFSRPVASRRDPSRHAGETTEPKVTGSNPVGCIHAGKRLEAHWSAQVSWSPGVPSCSHQSIQPRHRARTRTRTHRKAPGIPPIHPPTQYGCRRSEGDRPRLGRRH
jgi:integrase